MSGISTCRTRVVVAIEDGNTGKLKMRLAGFVTV
jgi:hypothetical protein